MTILILTDNVHAHALAVDLQARHGDMDVYQSPIGQLPGVPRCDVAERVAEIVERYDLVLSFHCKQRFPAALIDGVRCVNVHPVSTLQPRLVSPGLLDHRRAKVGVTIHEIDDQLDHGPIIAQRECAIESWDSSGSVYARLMDIERELVLEHFDAIRDGSYTAKSPATEGNLNLKKDFEQLRRLDLNERGTFGHFLNRLRALTHDDFRNAWFVDASGRKVFVRVVLEPEKPAEA